MKTTATGPRIVTPQDGETGFLGSIGVRFMSDGVETDRGFALVEQSTCCGPEAKDTCCREAAASRTCGCSEGQPDIRETDRVHERPSTAVVRTRAA